MARRKNKPMPIHIDIMPEFKVGGPPPNGYLEWHEWAEVQHRGGLRQVKCHCGLYHFPQVVCTREPGKVG